VVNIRLSPESNAAASVLTESAHLKISATQAQQDCLFVNGDRKPKIIRNPGSIPATPASLSASFAVCRLDNADLHYMFPKKLCGEFKAEIAFLDHFEFCSCFNDRNFATRRASFPTARAFRIAA
jgi:hypothetical protein